MQQDMRAAMSSRRLPYTAVMAYTMYSTTTM